MNTPFTPQEIIQYTNEYRAEKGLSPLKLNSKLMTAAQERAKDMVKTGAFSHQVATTTPNVTWDTFPRNAGYQGEYVGENLARDFFAATSTMEGWKKSPLHNKNLVYDKYKDVGVAIVPGFKNGRQTFYVVQFLGGDGEVAEKGVTKPMPVKNSTNIPIPGINTRLNKGRNLT